MALNRLQHIISQRMLLGIPGDCAYSCTYCSAKTFGDFLEVNCIQTCSDMKLLMVPRLFMSATIRAGGLSRTVFLRSCCLRSRSDAGALAVGLAEGASTVMPPTTALS